MSYSMSSTDIVNPATKKFSIVIPAFNEERYLSLCLESICQNDFHKDDIEIIVVDNGSTDRTKEIARSHGAEVISDSVKNVAGLRNLGASKARGEIIAFVDADCMVSRDWLKGASLYFDEPGVVAWGSPPLPPKQATWVQRTWFFVRQNENPVQEVSWLGTANLFVRREAFALVKGFDETLITCEDTDLCYRLLKYGKIVSDTRIEQIHLREPSTIKEFFFKEVWRGKGSFKGFFHHGLLLSELPSIAIPIYFGLIIPGLFLAVILKLSGALLAALLILYALPTIFVLYKLRRRSISNRDLPQLVILLQLYFLARTLAAYQRK